MGEEMARVPGHPQLYEINTRVWLDTLSRQAGRKLTLGTVPQEFWERLKDLGMDLVWLMGVWLPSPAGAALDRNNSALTEYCREILPDFTPEDLVGSPYAVAGYELNPALGSEEDLIRVRDNLHRAGLGLILDFVQNHSAQDHPWVTGHPQRYVALEPPDLFPPGEAFQSTGGDGVPRWIAHGRDPFFPPWPDTAQFCSSCPETRRSLAAELLQVARYCDGLRCDMAMLSLNQVFPRIWEAWVEKKALALPERDYWSEVMEPVKSKFPDFIWLAEVYWGLEGELLGQGFDYTYDKSGYDRLLNLAAADFRDGLLGEGDRSDRMARFLENHDEKRVAAAFPLAAFKAAAVIHATAPGLRLFHHGQLEGRRIKTPVQLGREPQEPDNPEIAGFYRKLLGLTRQPLFKQGRGYVLPVLPPYPGDLAHQPLVAFAYGLGNLRGVIAVNLSGQVASGFLKFPEEFWQGWSRTVLQDEMVKPAQMYHRSRENLETQGLYVLLPPFGHHFFTAADGERA
jgi:hypothetical protein